MRKVLLVSVSALTIGVFDFARAAESDEILARIEAVEKKNEAIERENALLRKEVADLRKLARASPKNSALVPHDKAFKRPNPPTTLSSSTDVVANFSGIRVLDRTAPIPAEAAARTFNWTGCYLGFHAGAGTLLSDRFQSGGGVGALGGGQVGCNYQTGMLVLGLEGEGLWSGVESRSHDYSLTIQPIGTTTSIDTGTVRNKWDFDLAARFGLTVDRALIYGKAGFVSGQFAFDELEICNGNCGNGAFPNSAISTLTGSARMTGLVIGLGLEYAFNEHWSAKFEYDYLNYFTNGTPFVICSTGGPCDYSSEASFSARADKQIVKVGLNYRFY